MSVRQNGQSGGASSNQLTATEQNLAILAFHLAEENLMPAFNLIHGMVDKLMDESMIDTGASSNYLFSIGAYASYTPNGGV